MPPLLKLVTLVISINLLDVGAADDERRLLDERIKSLVIVIISQPNSYHHAKALQLQENLYSQAAKLSQFRPAVHATHVDFPHVGAWTFAPLIPALLARHAAVASGVLFIQDDTVVDLARFCEVVAKHDQKISFIGHALHDDEPTIIHHFAFYDDPARFKYPNQASGFYLSVALLSRLNDRLSAGPLTTDFHIDPAHELALFVWNDGNGTALAHEAAFCATPPTDTAIECAAYPQPFAPCGADVDVDDVYFAVKTCRKHHQDRLKVVQATWAPFVRHVGYFSDVADVDVPTIDVGVPNVDVGHCEKTFAILRHAMRRIADMPSVAWVVLVDDDTILSVSHVLSLLSCYDPTEGVVLGERYGYGVRTPKGYNYVTGGGGTVLSRHVLPLLAAACVCPSARAPDDMYLGFCLRELGAAIVHSPLFHQARPNDYPKGYLKSHESNAVSFHKHWMVDPVNVYQTWFEKADLSLMTSMTSGSSRKRQEL